MFEFYPFSRHTHTNADTHIYNRCKAASNVRLQVFFFCEREIHKPIKNVKRMLLVSN